MKENKLILHFFILLVFLISIAAISASDFNNTDNKDFNDLYSNIVVEDSNFTFECDYQFNSSCDENYSGGINVTKDNFVINGNNHIINCNNQSRAFYITGDKVEINNLIIENAFYGYGSAIRPNCKLTLNNVTFINCFGDNETYNCGAIYCENSVLNINNCSGENGASLTSLSSTVNIVNSTFISSSDSIIKGHIFLDNSNLTVDNSNFLNTTSKYATAIFFENDGEITSNDSPIKLNITPARLKKFHNEELK